MFSWLAFMKHGEPRARLLRVKLPRPSPGPDLEEQERSFADGLADGVLRSPLAAGAQG